MSSITVSNSVPLFSPWHSADTLHSESYGRGRGKGRKRGKGDRETGRKRGGRGVGGSGGENVGIHQLSCEMKGKLGIQMIYG